MQNIGYHRGGDLSTVVLFRTFSKGHARGHVTSFSLEGKPHESPGFIV